MEDEEIEKFVLENQVDAISRCKYILGEKFPESEHSVEDIVLKLAESERKANFLCGFELLNKSSETIEGIKSYMEKQGYIKINDRGKIILTEKGLIRAKNKLPDVIEQYL